MKRIILAIDSFKGCLSSLEAEEAAEHGLNERWQGIEVVKVPVTDGGDGMLEVFYSCLTVKGSLSNVMMHSCALFVPAMVFVLIIL